MRTILAILGVLVIVTGCQQPGKEKNRSQTYRPQAVEEPEPEFENEFDRLVWLLGSPNFDKRREAHKELAAMGKEIIPDLEKAAEETRNEDLQQQIMLVLQEFKSRKKEEKRDLLLRLHVKNKKSELKKPVEMALEIKNTGNVPLDLTVPLLRKHSVGFRLDWIADMSFVSEGKVQRMEVTGTERDEWLASDWNPSRITLKPGESLKESMDITDLCLRAARFTAVATYRWIGVGDFMSNAVTFEVVEPPAPEEEPGGNGDK